MQKSNFCKFLFFGWVKGSRAGPRVHFGGVGWGRGRPVARKKISGGGESENFLATFFCSLGIKFFNQFFIQKNVTFLNIDRLSTAAKFRKFRPKNMIFKKKFNHHRCSADKRCGENFEKFRAKNANYKYHFNKHRHDADKCRGEICPIFNIQSRKKYKIWFILTKKSILKGSAVPIGTVRKIFKEKYLFLTKEYDQKISILSPHQYDGRRGGGTGRALTTRAGRGQSLATVVSV